MIKKPLYFIITVILFAGLFSRCSHPVWLSHRFNEEGLSLYSSKDFKNSGSFFEKSIAQQFREEIPTFNLANNYYAQGNFTVAHQYYERSIILKPELKEALFNDGHALYMWGRSQLDRNFCNIERTLSLWDKSINRFMDATGVSGASTEYGVKSEVIIDFIKQKVEFIKAKHEENMELCKEKSGGGSSKNGKKEKKDKDKTGNGKDKTPPGRDPGSKISSAGQEGEKITGSETLTLVEKEIVHSALQRIKRDSGKFRFNQSKSQQVRKGKGRDNVGEVISW